MNLTKLSGAPMALTLLLLVPRHVGAQPSATQPHGSRPGETYQSGPATNARSASPASATSDAAASTRQASSPQQSAPAMATSSGDQALPAGTPVIMEFSDLQCPDSARFNTGLKNTLTQRYVSNGNAIWQWHDFPLPVHSQAPEAAAAARCAGPSADRMRQQIMANQGQMSEAAYAQYARQLGVDSGKFSACLRSGATAREVAADEALGKSMGVRGTPTLVLGIADGQGQVKPVKVIKAYDPPQQVMAAVESFMANSRTAPAPAKLTIPPRIR